MYAIFLLLLLISCSQDDFSRLKGEVKGEYIYREEGEYLFKPEPVQTLVREAYPWEDESMNSGVKGTRFPKITKEFFRCKGSTLNPSKSEKRAGETVTLMDCGGADKHSLPLINGKEGVYPILIDLLNFIQVTTKKRVVITSGHRCPDHNVYVDSSSAKQVSKHLIGAEVTFYVQGMEDKPEEIVKILQAFYQQDPKTKNDKKYLEFKRYEKQDTDVSTQPWMNHEIFIKLYQKKEGRDFDHRHPYPYLSVQARVDRETGSRIIYTWDKAYNNFLRY